MSGNSRRSDRMSQLLRAEIAQLLVEEVSDPGLRNVSITDVQVAKDLKSAEVFYMTLSPQESKTTSMALGKVIPFLRRRLAERTEIRFVPQLRFLHDDHTENLTHLMSLIETSKPSGGSSEGDPE